MVKTSSLLSSAAASFVVVVIVVASSVASALPSCSSDRPGWAKHRTLYIPNSKVTNSAEESAHVNALCCVYTHVSTTYKNYPYMKIFDGSKTYPNGGGNSIQIMENAMDDICDMQMGSNDCSSQSSCVNNAFAPAPTRDPTTKPVTPPPTRLPTPSPTKLPTPSPTRLPTPSPTKFPTRSPTPLPTPSPTKLPTPAPTPLPTPSPTKLPTRAPTRFPTSFPTKLPTPAPTRFPTSFPTNLPTPAPTRFPTSSPSKSPTTEPPISTTTATNKCKNLKLKYNNKKKKNCQWVKQKVTKKPEKKEKICMKTWQETTFEDWCPKSCGKCT